MPQPRALVGQAMFVRKPAHDAIGVIPAARTCPPRASCVRDRLIRRSRRTSSSTNENDVAGVELGTRPDGTAPHHEHLADVESSTGEQPSAMYRRGCRHKPSIEPGLRQEAIGVASPEGTPW